MSRNKKLTKKKKLNKDMVLNIVLVSIIAAVFITLLTIFIVKIANRNKDNGIHYSQSDDDWGNDSNTPLPS